MRATFKPQRSSSVQLAGAGEAEGTGGGAFGIAIVCPACNFRPSSILLAFCNSSTLTLYILAMEVSVSPRATVCVFPFIGCEADSAGTAGVDGEDVLSPTITPGRICAICCSSLRISCESASIFAFCSSIFFANASSCGALDGFDGSGDDVWAETDGSSVRVQKKVLNKIATSFIAQNFGITGFVWQGAEISNRISALLAFPTFPSKFFHARAHPKAS